MKEKMIQYFEGCGFSRAEAEKETAIHIREIQRRELPDRITEEQACNYFMMDLIFEQEIKAGETPQIKLRSQRMFEKEAEEYCNALIQNEIKVKSIYDIEVMQKDLEKFFQDAAEFGYKKANEWHYPSKGELPEKTGRYLILNRFGEHYFTTNITEYLEGAKLFSMFSMKEIYAWKEIVLPELKETK